MVLPACRSAYGVQRLLSTLVWVYICGQIILFLFCNFNDNKLNGAVLFVVLFFPPGSRTLIFTLLIIFGLRCVGIAAPPASQNLYADFHGSPRPKTARVFKRTAVSESDAKFTTEPKTETTSCGYLGSENDESPSHPSWGPTFNQGTLLLVNLFLSSNFKKYP